MRQSPVLLSLAALLLIAAGPSDSPPAKPVEEEAVRTMAPPPPAPPPSPPRVSPPRPTMVTAPPPIAFSDRGSMDRDRMPKYTPKPAIWQFADKDTTITLFGSVHALDGRLKWRTPLFDGIVKDADRFIFESALDDRQSVEDRLDEVMPRLFHYNRPKLIDRVAPENREELKSLLFSGRLPRYMLNGLPSYFAQAALIPASRSGHSIFSSRESGVETILRREIKIAGKPLLGLEDGPETYVSLYSWDEKAQDKALNDALTARRNATFKQGRNHSIGAIGELELKWVTGQMVRGSLADYVAHEPPLAMAAVFGNRNTKWVPQLLKQLDTPGKALVVVGSGHFFGPDNLLDMLAKRGIKLNRIQ